MPGTARVLGIDLSGRTTGRTALAVATGAADRVEAELVRSHGEARLPRRPALRRLAAMAVELDVDLVAIDAPLTLPHAWTCERENCDECFPVDGDDPVYTVRDCERFEVWAEATPVRAHPMPTALLGALAVRGRYLRRAVEREGIATLETWPAGSLLQLAPRGATKPSSSKDPESYARWAGPGWSPTSRRTGPRSKDRTTWTRSPPPTPVGGT